MRILKPLPGALPMPERNIVGDWLLNSLGGMVFDLSGNQYTGTLDGNVFWSSGIYGSVIDCPEVEADQVDFGDVAAWEFSGEFTVHIRFLMRPFADAFASVFGRANNSNNVPNWTWNLFCYNDYDISFGMGNFVNFDLLTDVFVGNANIWYDVFVVCKTDTINLYVDGIYRGQAPRINVVQTRQTANSFYIHEDTVGLSSDFQVSDASLYNRALIASEIAQLYPEPFYRYPESRVFAVA